MVAVIVKTCPVPAFAVAVVAGDAAGQVVLLAAKCRAAIDEA